MFSREKNPGSGRAGRVKPRLENLEDRCCPSASSLTPHLALTANPSLTSNTILVRDDGHGDVTATVNGKAATYHGVQTIDVTTAAGTDQVGYSLTGVLKQSESLTLHLAKGDVQARLDYGKGIASPKAGVTPHVNVKVEGGGGDDNVSAAFGVIDNADLNLTAKLGSGWDHFAAQFQGDLKDHAAVNVNVTGGTGVSGVNIDARGTINKDASLSIKAAQGSADDTLHVDYAGKLLGHLSIQENAGAGWDWLETNVDLAAGSTGWLAAHEVGGAGADLLILMARNANQLKGMDGLISGVNDMSAVSHTANVKVSGH